MTKPAEPRSLTYELEDPIRELEARALILSHVSDSLDENEEAMVYELSRDFEAIAKRLRGTFQRMLADDRRLPS